MVSSRPSQVSATVLKLRLPWLSGQLSPTGQTDHLLVEVANWGRSHQLLRSSCSGTVRTSPNPSPPSSPCRNRRQRWTDHTWPGQLHQACLWPLTPVFLCLKGVWVPWRPTWGGWTCSVLPSMAESLVNSLVFRITPLWLTYQDGCLNSVCWGSHSPPGFLP